MDDLSRGAGGQLGEYAYQKSGERSSADLVKDIIANVQEMVRSEVRLAKAELREEAAKTWTGAQMLIAGAGAALFALGFLLTATAQFLSLFIAASLATLLIAVVLGAVAAVMISKGRGQVRLPTPGKTIENLKENVEWMKNQTRS